MKNTMLSIIRIVALVLIWLVWWGAIVAKLALTVDLILLFASSLLIGVVVVLGRRWLDRNPTLEHAQWVTTVVQYLVGLLFGMALIRAIAALRAWPLWVIPLPAWVGLTLVIVTGAATLFSMLNLALKGLGAPFAVALSQKVAQDWMYAWTRNPMVLSAIALLVSLGLWFRSTSFVLWALLLFTPAILVFIKGYEERELEIRFGESYLAYKAKTPLLFPRRPKSKSFGKNKKHPRVCDTSGTFWF